MSKRYALPLMIVSLTCLWAPWAPTAAQTQAPPKVQIPKAGVPEIMTMEGKFVRAFGTGMFKVPHGLRIDREGNIWTTDNGNHVLRKFTSEGRLVTTLGTEGKAGGGKEGFRSYFCEMGKC